MLLQATRERGWGDAAELAEALAGHERFVLEHVVAEDGTATDDTYRSGKVRLYNFPWYAWFLLGQGRLDHAVRIVDRYYALGGDHYLAFGLGPLLGTLATRLTTAGRDDDATRRLPWLTAFAADQPDARLRHIPIRHWDGYWFGRQRLWGDVFPHYWSVLSADVLLSWPDELADPATLERLRAAGWAILRANLANFRPDGSATCAFVYPSCVNGVPAHVADPLANDQDWALVYALRLGLGRTP